MESDRELWLKQFRTLHGWVLPHICEGLGLPEDPATCDAIKTILKRYFRVPHTKELSTQGLRIFIASCCMFASREWGVFVPDTGDPDNAVDMSLSEYLQFKQQQYDRLQRSNEIRSSL